MMHNSIYSRPRTFLLVSWLSLLLFYSSRTL